MTDARQIMRRMLTEQEEPAFNGSPQDAAPEGGDVSPEQQAKAKQISAFLDQMSAEEQAVVELEGTDNAIYSDINNLLGDIYQGASTDEVRQELAGLFQWVEADMAPEQVIEAAEVHFQKIIRAARMAVELARGITGTPIYAKPPQQ